ncbi:MAG: DUF1854 domain-containing protein [Phycisphaerae bacterium]
MTTAHEDSTTESAGQRMNADEPETATVERVELDEAGRLVVYLEGRDQPVEDAAVARCFPWSLPDGYISVRDSKGREVAMLTSLEELDADSRHIIEGELRDKIFNPKILTIKELRDEFGVLTITAETDRGEVSFQVRRRDDVRVLSGGRALLKDVDGNTYELPDINRLDKTSRKHFLQYF